MPAHSITHWGEGWADGLRVALRPLHPAQKKIKTERERERETERERERERENKLGFFSTHL